MPNQPPSLDLVFHALADPTRRAVVERLSRGPSPMSQLAQPFKMALPSFAQHLGVLEKSGLIKSSKTGRVRTFSLAPSALERADHWLNQQRALWERRLDQLDEFLLQQKEQEHD